MRTFIFEGLSLAISAEQLEDFQRFASEKVKDGDTELTIEELLRLWRMEYDRLDSVNAIKKGIAEVEAGRVHALEDVNAKSAGGLTKLFARICHEL